MPQDGVYFDVYDGQVGGGKTEQTRLQHHRQVPGERRYFQDWWAMQSQNEKGKVGLP